MSINDAASALLSQIHAPRGLVNILPVTDGSGAHLVVWVDTQYMRQINPLPETFEGYPVTVMSRPMAIGYRH